MNDQRKKRTVGLELTTSNQDIYTVPSRFTTDITSISISNESGSSVTFTLDWYDLATTTYYTLAGVTSLAANSILQIKEYPLYLVGGDKIRGLASANSAINITVSLEEFFQTSL
jgi:hypothetical protein